MLDRISPKILSVEVHQTCDAVYREISNTSKIVDFPGIAVVISDSTKVLGVVTDGDFRRAYSNDYDFEKPISTIMNTTPLMITDTELVSFNFLNYRKWLDDNSKVPSVCIVTNNENKLLGAVENSLLLEKIKSEEFTSLDKE